MMYYEYRDCFIELLASPFEYYKWIAHVYFPDSDNQCVGDDFDDVPAARFAAIQLIEKERIIHHSDCPSYCF